MQVECPMPTHGQTMSEDMFDKAQLAPWRTLGDAIGDMDDPGEVGLDFSPRKKHFLARVPQGSNWRSLPQEAQKQSMGKAWDAKGGRSGWWRRLNFDLPSRSEEHTSELQSLMRISYAV